MKNNLLQKIILTLLLVLFIILTSCTTIEFQSNPPVKLNVEIADGQSEWTRGLMYRQSLAENRGMLFIFPEETPRKFWMKNTIIPLDMIFLDKHKQVIDIQHATPCTSDPCITYTPKKPAQYVIETNAGFAQIHNIKEGIIVRLP